LRDIQLRSKLAVFRQRVIRPILENVDRRFNETQTQLDTLTQQLRHAEEELKVLNNQLSGTMREIELLRKSISSMELTAGPTPEPTTDVVSEPVTSPEEKTPIKVVKILEFNHNPDITEEDYSAEVKEKINTFMTALRDWDSDTIDLKDLRFKDILRLVFIRNSEYASMYNLALETLHPKYERVYLTRRMSSNVKARITKLFNAIDLSK